MKIYTTAFSKAFRRNFSSSIRRYGIYSLMWENMAELELRSLGYSTDDYELYHQASWESEAVLDEHNQPIAEFEVRRILDALHTIGLDDADAMLDGGYDIEINNRIAINS